MPDNGFNTTTVEELQQLLQSMQQSNSKVKKTVKTTIGVSNVRNSSEQNKFEFLTKDTIQDENKLALEVIIQNDSSLPVCSSMTSSSHFNKSRTYEYANNVPYTNCSHPQITSHNPNSPKFCQFFTNQNRCPYYFPDFEVISVATINNSFNTVLYLTRYRADSGNYCYKIYDDQRNVYYNLNYQNISSFEDLDREARIVFNDAISEAFGSFSFHVQDSQVLISKSSNSYIKNLVSQES